MTPIQKAKEIIRDFLQCYFGAPFESDDPKFQLEWERWLQTKSAAAILSGEDWISVKTELPPIGKDVLVVENDGFDNGVDIATYTGKNREFYRPFKPIQVTHWMNIPALPEPIKP